MYEFITQDTLAEYESFIASHPKGHFAQSSLWGKQKAAWTWRAVAVRGQDGKIKGTMAFLIRKMPVFGASMLYACRGPVCDLEDKETFGQLLEGAKALAKELGPSGIRVNAIAPGFFASEQNAKLLFNEDGTPTDRTKKILAATPMGHFGDSEKDLVGALLFLLNNDAAGFITGICLPVDGGFSAYSGV